MITKKVYEKLNDIPEGHARGRLTTGCLVIEGGAFRGLYNQGVMDFFMENNLNFECVIGVSAGAAKRFILKKENVGIREYSGHQDKRKRLRRC